MRIGEQVLVIAIGVAVAIALLALVEWWPPA
jgi:hypothetical protein